MNKEAILEGLLFVVGDEGLTLDNICEIMMIEKSEAQELLKKLREEYSKEKCYTNGKGSNFASRKGQWHYIRRQPNNRYNCEGI